jgi:hypothetical protein
VLVVLLLLQEEDDDWVSALVEPGTGSSRLLIAGSSGVLYTLDLITNKLAQQVGGGRSSCGMK